MPATGATWQYNGYIDVELYPSKLLVRWEGEEDWYAIDWWELMVLVEAQPPKLREDLQWERERAYSEALEPFAQEMREAEARAYQRGRDELLREQEAERKTAVAKGGIPVLVR